MPTLPSGLTLLIDSPGLDHLLCLDPGAPQAREVLAVRSREDLPAWYRIVRVHPDLRTAPASLIPARRYLAAEQLLPGSIDEPLGCTVADWERVARGWSDADRQAFREYLAGPEVAAMFSGKLEEVAAARQRITAGKPGTATREPVPPDASRIEAIERRIREFEEAKEAAQERLRALLPFRCEDLPYDDYGAAMVMPKAPPGWKIGGRDAIFESLHQYWVYAGLLSGLPDDPEKPIAAAVKTAIRLHPSFAGKPSVIPPRLRRGQPEDSGPWVLIPPVAVIAEARAGDRVAVMVWFQDHYGAPPPEILAALATFNWSEHGIDWDP